jgi:hypothetical protein
MGGLHDLFNRTTLDNYMATATSITDYTVNYPREHFAKFKSDYPTVYLSPEEKQNILFNVLDGQYDRFAGEFAEKITDLKQDLLDKLPSKKKELEAIAEAEKKNAEEAARLRAEAEKREKEEKERLAREAAEREKKAQEEVERKKSEAEMNDLFDAAEATASDDSSSSRVRKSWTIEITHQAGYVQIFQLWFEHEGTKLSLDKFDRKTLGQMKRFCESLAGKEDIRIDSPYIKYKEDYKAIAKS